ncbi:MAG: succinate dehydrogenase, cytochrome b556 subunit [Candidatus Marinimicrobia bacterium]|nr:succinate dehydrogenase, cytochrome b556 subunit [Candidatus Neomarinimicrobiota bacterium]
MNFQLGMFSFIMHRITGLMLLFFALLLLVSMGIVHFSSLSFDEMFNIYQLPALRIITSIFLMALVWHMLNGVRILIIDLFRAAYMQRLLSIIVNVLFLALAVLYYIYLFPPRTKI